MTLPNMKIWTGGMFEYTERVQKALHEIGLHGYHDLPHQFDYLVTNDSGDIARGAGRGAFDAHDKPEYRLADNGNLVPQEADDEGWIEWGGGECPVDGGTHVEIRTATLPDAPNDGPACTYHWEHTRRDRIIRYRVPSQIFPSSQRKPEPVHQMKHGDYILREDIPDEATFRRVCEVLERQGVPMESESLNGEWMHSIHISVFMDHSYWGNGLCPEYVRNRITPADLGITTQEADMTPCEKKGLRKGQWVWAKRNTSYGVPAQWIQLWADDGTDFPRFFHCYHSGNGSGKRFRKFSEIDWQAGIHNEKPGTEDSMSETLTGAEALREVAQGYEEGDENPWERIEWKSSRDAWAPVGGPRSFGVVLSDGDTLRRKPRTVRIEGRVSEESLDGLRKLERSRVEIGGNAMSDMAAEILSTVQDQ